MVAEDKARSAGSIYQLRISLEETEPEIWRRVLVRDGTSLDELHLVIQDVMGWSNSHLYEFEIRGGRFEAPESEAEGQDSSRTKLKDFGLEISDAFVYTYDFGDDWRHVLVLEAQIRAERGRFYPCCVAGERACPPEDCGGVGMFAELLAGLADPSEPRYSELLDWVDPGYDPAAFDVRPVNRNLELAHRRGAV
jgi:hypothetical protein